jgi:N-acetylmuramate 1-kinase
MSVDARLELLNNWLKNQLDFNKYTIEPASADASFRRYFRITTDKQTWVAMDAPPEKEDCESFVRIAQMIESVGVQSPHIYHYNKQQGFILLSDLGSKQYLDSLTNNDADSLYKDAIDALIKMQTIQNKLPLYDVELLQFEMSLFRDWYLQQHLNISLTDNQHTILQKGFYFLIQSAIQQPQVFVHRDYHSRNLMITENNNPGVIDFQDAVTGPLTYDLVSLLKDCYIAWPRQKTLNWLNYFIDTNPLTKNIDPQEFIKWFDLMGMQRHLKAVGIFSRLNHRDNKPGYLNDIPRTLTYIIDTSAHYPELIDFSKLLKELNLSANQQILDRIQ